MFLLLNALLAAATPHGLAEEPSREYLLLLGDLPQAGRAVFLELRYRPR